MNNHFKFRHYDHKEGKMYYQEDLFHSETMGLLYATELTEGKGALTHMLYSGLKDKNGVEIYQKDVIRHDEGGLVHGDLSEVTIDQGVFGITIPYDLRHLPLRNNETIYAQNDYQGNPKYANHLAKIKVIGNILENPELI